MRRTKNCFSNYQSLENRRLLAGDVSVGVSDSVLNIVGDSLANEIQVSFNESGNLVVSGTDTTINGADSTFTVDESYRFLSLFMGDGDDSVSIDNVTMNRNVSFFGDVGNDRLTVSNTTARHLHAEGGAGNDVFELEMRTRKSAYLYLGDGDDVVALPNFNAGRNFKIFAGAGNDTIATNTVGVGRRLEVNLEAGDDSFLAAGDTYVRRNATIEAADGNDVVVFNPDTNEAINLRSKLTVNGGIGDDSVSIGESISVKRSSSFDGGEGTDSIGLSTQLTDSEATGFENQQIANLQTLLDGVFATLISSEIGAVDFGGESQNEPLTLAATDGAVSFTEGGDPVAVDDGITIGAESGTTISNASISIGGFASGQDVLTFDDTAAISGTFDDQTGVLSLSGSDTVENYQAALRAITFSNGSASPSTDQRTIQFSVTAGDETATASRSLNIVAVNSAPVIELSETSRTVSFTELPTTIDGSLTLSDEDNAELSQAIVQISSGFTANEDVLEFDLQSGINATFDPSTGTLTASGSAVIADYVSFLRSVRYENTSSTPSTGVRTIRFSVGDGADTASEDFSLTLQNI